MNLNSAIVAYKRDTFPTLSPSTRRLYLTVINIHLVPALGLREMSTITQADMQALHIKLGGSPYMANRVLAFASLLFVHYKLPNPAKGVRRYNEDTREYYLGPEELTKLFETLASHRDKAFVTAIKLLVFTGCRRQEILDAEWKHVDFNRKQLLVPHSKTGKKFVVLNEYAIKVLRGAYSHKARYVIEGETPDKPRVNITKEWHKQRAALGFPQARIHDLRHTFASMVANTSANIFTLRDLLHHSNVAVTQRYAHLFDTTLREASDGAFSGLSMPAL